MRTEEELAANFAGVATLPADERDVADAHGIGDLRDRRTGVAGSHPSRRNGRGSSVFELRDLEVKYNGHTAVREVDLDIAAQEITAFIGPSGCGKTTVLAC